MPFTTDTTPQDKTNQAWAGGIIAVILLATLYFAYKKLK